MALGGDGRRGGGGFRAGTAAENGVWCCDAGDYGVLRAVSTGDDGGASLLQSAALFPGAVFSGGAGGFVQRQQGAADRALLEFRGVRAVRLLPGGVACHGEAALRLLAPDRPCDPGRFCALAVRRVPAVGAGRGLLRTDGPGAEHPGRLCRRLVGRSGEGHRGFL